MMEATGISPEARITAECTGIWNDAQRDRWSRVVDFVHAKAPEPAYSWHYAGRKASDYRGFTAQAGPHQATRRGGWMTIAPSPIPFTGAARPYRTGRGRHCQSPRRLRRGRPARRGCRLRRRRDSRCPRLPPPPVLPPPSNARTDGYGGSLQNRARLLLKRRRGKSSTKSAT